MSTADDWVVGPRDERSPFEASRKPRGTISLTKRHPQHLVQEHAWPPRATAPPCAGAASPPRAGAASPPRAGAASPSRAGAGAPPRARQAGAAAPSRAWQAGRLHLFGLGGRRRHLLPPPLPGWLA
jgi:hypothetical protein